MKKVLLVYESLETPSTMVRALQFRECFERDTELEVAFIGRTSEPINAVMKRWPWRPSLRRPASAVESAIIRRRESQIVDIARQCDVVMMMTVPSWPLHQRLAELSQTRLITDLIDALWLPCFQSQGWHHIHEMLASSDAVICENEYTAHYTRQHSNHVVVVPDGPQLEVFDQYRASADRDDRQCRIGWIGGKYTADALYRVFESLEQCFSQHPDVHLRLVGADPDRIPRFENVRYSVVPSYDQQTMVKEVLAMDIGIFPMFNVSESLYRGTLKTKVYMSGEAAVIGQRLGENETLIRDGENGVLAGDHQQWCDALSRLIQDVPFRRRIARAGLETIEREFTRNHCYQRLRDVILNVGSTSGLASDS
ncbi:MAG: glycosyltransferase family 4 protein [Phycisphaera sp. RhM]|nr:glycosyltransferase family 4 protein [Phycisphaera sp. RhM]